MNKVDTDRPKGGHRNIKHFLHRWVTIKGTWFYRYEICTVCGARRITQRRKNIIGATQPVDLTWYNTGKWSKYKPPCVRTR